jgi:hypothetical protein
MGNNRAVGWSSEAFYLYLGGGVFESRTGNWLSRLKYFVVFLSRPRKMPRYHLKLGHGRFLPHPFQLFIHCEELHFGIMSCNLYRRIISRHHAAWCWYYTVNHCWSWSSHSGDWRVLSSGIWRRVIWYNLQTFLKNVQPPSSGSKRKQSK